MFGMCEDCDEVFSFDPQLQNQRPLTIPKGLRIDRDKRLNWSHSRYRLLGGVCALFGLLFLRAGYAASLATSSGVPMFVFGCGFGGAIAYCGSALALNRWTMSLDETHLVLSYRPVPFRKAKRVPRSAIQQLYVHEKQGTGRGAGHALYDVFVQLKSGRTVQLVKSLTDPASASYIVWHIENALGIIHRPVAGEYVAAPHVLARSDAQPSVGSLQLASPGHADEAGALSVTSTGHDVDSRRSVISVTDASVTES